MQVRTKREYSVKVAGWDTCCEKMRNATGKHILTDKVTLYQIQIFYCPWCGESITFSGGRR